MARKLKNPPKGRYAWTVTVGEKGQIVIPKQARDIFDINPGDTLLILGDEKKGMAIPPTSKFMNIAAGQDNEDHEDNEEED